MYRSHGRRHASNSAQPHKRNGKGHRSSHSITFDPADMPAGLGHNNKEGTINALQMVHDAFYYMGFMQIGKFAIFLFFGIILLLFHVSTLNNAPNTAFFRASITNLLATQPFPPDGPAWANVNNFHQAAVYYKTVIQCMINESSAQGLPEPTIRLGEYGTIFYIRIVANFDQNCVLHRQRTGAECWLHQYETGFDYDIGHSLNQSVPAWFRKGPPSKVASFSKWHTTSGDYFRFRSSTNSITDWQAMVLFPNSADQPNTRQEVLDKLDQEMDDFRMGMLGRFTYSLGMDIIAYNSLDTDFPVDDYGIFSLLVQRNRNGRGDVDVKAFNKLSSTTSGRRVMYASSEDRNRKFVELCFWGFFLYVMALDFVQLKLALRQGTTLITFFRHYWNIYNWAVNFAIVVWGCAYVVLWVVWNNYYTLHQNLWDRPPYTSNDFYNYEYFPTLYGRWVYAGIGLILLIGLRLIQFSRLLPGVNVFHIILAKTLTDLADFFIVFLYILCLFGTCVFMIFQLNGGNLNWVAWDDGIALLARLAFSQAGYNDIYNDGIGSDNMGYVITLIFWFCIATLFVFSGNIFLSAVSYAYGTVRDQHHQVEVFLMSEIMYRFLFDLCWFYWMLVGHRLFELKGRFWPSVGTADPPPSISPQTLSSSSLSSDPEAPPDSEVRKGLHPIQSLTPSGIPHGQQQGYERLPSAPASSTSTVPMGGGSLDGRGGSGAKVGTGKAHRPVGDAIIGGARSYWMDLWDRWYHRPSVDYYKILFPKRPEKNPRRYMMSRWAVACRPEAQALATYFIEFRKFGLCSLKRPKRQVISINDPFLLPPLYHKPFTWDNAQPELINWDGIGDAEMVALLEAAKLSHDKLLRSLRWPLTWMTRIMFGFFWMDYHKEVMPQLIARVYNSEYIKQIESSSAIDDDDDLATPTVADLRAEVDKMKEQMKRMEEAMMAQLQRIAVAVNAPAPGVVPEELQQQRRPPAAAGSES